MDRDVDPAWELRLASGEVAIDHGDALIQESFHDGGPGGSAALYHATNCRLSTAR